MEHNELSTRFDALENMLKEALAELRKGSTKVVDLEEAALILKRSEQAVYNLVNRRELECNKVVGKLYFDRAYLDRWMMSNTLPTIADMAQDQKLRKAS